ncbi:MAG: hypothetical protein IJ800_06050, partial [Clostridia bacterium]|nr:hypothetical protein [Clostridia bacterium]
KAGEKDAKLCFIPFYAFWVANRLTGVFSVLTIPVKRFHVYVVELVAIVLLAFVYGCWGEGNLPEPSIPALWQIMGVIMGICAFLLWMALLSSSGKIYRRFNAERENAAKWLSSLVITIPFIYVYYAVKNTPRELKDMY